MNRRHDGFTLIELLAVIAILALLMGILLPSLQRARELTKAKLCLSNLKGMGTAVAIYLNENDDNFFPGRLKKLDPSDEKTFINDYMRQAPRWQWFLETDLGPVIDPKPFERLGADGFDDYGLHLGGDDGRRMAVDLFVCPTLDDERYERDVRNGAYGYNYQYLGNARTDTDPDRWDNFSVGLHRIRSPSDTVAIADSRGAGRRHGEHSYALDPPRLASERRAQRFGPTVSDLDHGTNADVYQYSPVEARHNDQGNVLFVDGHGAAKSLKELGYQLHDGSTFQGVPEGTPIPMPHPYKGPYEANNKLWNGIGVDKIAAEANPP